MKRLFKNRMFTSVLLSVVLTFMFVFAVAYSATTISTNIATDGNLTVTGTAGITGVTTMVNASTTNISTIGNIWANGFATTTGSNGNIATQGTLTVTGAVWATSTLQATGAATLYSTLNVTGVTTMVNASTTQALTVAGAAYLNGDVQFNGFATTTGSSGNFATQGTLTVTGTSYFATASSTSLRVGSGPDVTTVSGLSFGFCNMPTVTVAASSTAFGICTPNTASSINASSLVFVQATSSLLTNFIIQAASSTAAGTISVQIFNTGMIAGVATGAISLNFIGIR